MTSHRNGGNIIALVIMVNGQHIVKGFSNKLQKIDADVVAAYNLIDTAIDEVRIMRADFDSVCRNWFRRIEIIAADVGLADADLLAESLLFWDISWLHVTNWVLRG